MLARSRVLPIIRRNALASASIQLFSNHLARRLAPSGTTHPLARRSMSASMSTTRTAMRQSKMTVSAPASVPRLRGDELQLQTMQDAEKLLEQLKPQFTTKLHLQAIGLPGRQLPLVTKDDRMLPHLFNAAGVRYVQPHPNGDPAHRIVLLDVPSSSPTPPAVLELVAKHDFELVGDVPLELGYDHLSSDQVLEALLPTQIVAAEGVPSGFTIVGHIAHLNLLDIYLPFRFLVGHVILSKHAGSLRTVVNKLDTIDTEFRFFKMELLAGQAQYTASVSESECTFEFDFRSVYWNSRLHAEHMRLIKRCRPNQVLADVMAGVGPFAVPAAKRGAWVLANDLNPSSHESLVRNAKINKVGMDESRADGGLVATCMDGREFVRWAVVETWKRAFRGRPKGYDAQDSEADDERLRESVRKAAKERAKKLRDAHAARAASKTLGELEEATSRLAVDNAVVASLPDVERWEPRLLVDHFVMNLPATALEFLDAFRGAYTHLAASVGVEAVKAEVERRSASGDGSMTNVPMVHVHCFSKDPFQPARDILTRANAALGISDSEHRLRCKPIAPPPQTLAALRKSPAATATYIASHPNYNLYTNANTQEAFMTVVNQQWQHLDQGIHTPGLEVHYVRDVAPNKQMYCLSFPLPPQVLWSSI
ncbi:tRNA (guanine) methyltransferase [Moesziomyces antarcticus]|nr:tRNA (guanine) methyltransferase [Moesziomyces antarcticus]GAK62369.1 tRNA (guanine) methyltransferase [Moesziomyces antarcticus]